MTQWEPVASGAWLSRAQNPPVANASLPPKRLFCPKPREALARGGGGGGGRADFGGGGGSSPRPPPVVRSFLRHQRRRRKYLV